VYLLPTRLLTTFMRSELPRPPRSDPQLLAALRAYLRPTIEGHRQRVLPSGRRAGEGGNITRQAPRVGDHRLRMPEEFVAPVRAQASVRGVTGVSHG